MLGKLFKLRVQINAPIRIYGHRSLPRFEARLGNRNLVLTRNELNR